MSGLGALSAGLRRARGSWRLALLLWLANLGLALLAAVPAWFGLQSALARAPEGDRLLAGFSFGLLSELLRGNEAVAQLWLLFAAGLGLVALLLNALLAGGLLEVLASPGGPLLASFGRGAGGHLRRFLRLGALAALGFALSAGLALIVTAPLRRRLEDSPWEPMPLVVAAGTALMLGLLALVWMLALDLARVRVAAEELQRVRPALRAGLRRVLTGLRPLGLWSAYGLACLGLIAAYAAFRNAVPAASWPGIAVMLAVQQAVMLARALLRLALWGAFFELQASAPVDPAAARSSNG